MMVAGSLHDPYSLGFWVQGTKSLNIHKFSYYFSKIQRAQSPLSIPFFHPTQRRSLL